MMLICSQIIALTDRIGPLPGPGTPHIGSIEHFPHVQPAKGLTPTKTPVSAEEPKCKVVYKVDTYAVSAITDFNFKYSHADMRTDEDHEFAQRHFRGITSGDVYEVGHYYQQSPVDTLIILDTSTFARETSAEDDKHESLQFSRVSATDTSNRLLPVQNAHSKNNEHAQVVHGLGSAIGASRWSVLAWDTSYHPVTTSNLTPFTSIPKRMLIFASGGIRILFEVSSDKWEEGEGTANCMICQLLLKKPHAGSTGTEWLQNLATHAEEHSTLVFRRTFPSTAGKAWILSNVQNVIAMCIRIRLMNTDSWYIVKAIL